MSAARNDSDHTIRVLAGGTLVTCGGAAASDPYRTPAPETSAPRRGLRNPNFWAALRANEEWLKRLDKYGRPDTHMVREGGHCYSVYTRGPGDPDVYEGRVPLDHRYCEEWHDFTLLHEWKIYTAMTGHTPKINPK